MHRCNGNKEAGGTHSCDACAVCQGGALRGAEEMLKSAPLFVA